MTDRIGLNELEEGQVLLQVLQVSAGGSVEQVEVVRHTADPQPDPPDPPQHQVRLTDYPLGVADVERERESGGSNYPRQWRLAVVGRVLTAVAALWSDRGANLYRGCSRPPLSLISLVDQSDGGYTRQT